MTIKDYLNEYETEDHTWLADLGTWEHPKTHKRVPRMGFIQAGMLKWVDAREFELAGPFEGGFAVYKLVDYSYQKEPQTNPVCFRISGNDDASWVKYYPTQAEAVEDLTLLEGCGPLTVKDIKGMGFVDD